MYYKEKKIKSIKLTLCIAIFLCLDLVYIFANQQPQVDEVESSFDNSGLPGFSGGIYYLFDDQSIYSGGSVRFSFFYSLDANRKSAGAVDRGRSEIYIAVGLYAATPPREDSRDLFFNYVFGFNIAFETPSVLSRNFFIPYIGLEIGGIYIQEIGNGFMTCPILGINLVSLPTFTMSVECGLLLTTNAFEQFLALKPQLNISFVL